MRVEGFFIPGATAQNVPLPRKGHIFADLRAWSYGDNGQYDIDNYNPQGETIDISLPQTSVVYNFFIIDDQSVWTVSSWRNIQSRRVYTVTIAAAATVAIFGGSYHIYTDRVTDVGAKPVGYPGLFDPTPEPYPFLFKRAAEYSLLTGSETRLVVTSYLNPFTGDGFTFVKDYLKGYNYGTVTPPYSYAFAAPTIDEPGHSVFDDLQYFIANIDSETKAQRVYRIQFVPAEILESITGVPLLIPVGGGKEAWIYPLEPKLDVDIDLGLPTAPNKLTDYGRQIVLRSYGRDLVTVDMCRFVKAQIYTVFSGGVSAFLRVTTADGVSVHSVPLLEIRAISDTTTGWWRENGAKLLTDTIGSLVTTIGAVVAAVATDGATAPLIAPTAASLINNTSNFINSIDRASSATAAVGNASPQELVGWGFDAILSCQVTAEIATDLFSSVKYLLTKYGISKQTLYQAEVPRADAMYNYIRGVGTLFYTTEDIETIGIDDLRRHFADEIADGVAFWVTNGSIFPDICDDYQLT